MTRNLHITIFEDARCDARRRSGRGAGAGFDPEASEATLPPDNPEASEATLPPDNPEASEATLPPDNPEASEATLPPDNPEASEATLPPDNPAYRYAVSHGGPHGCGCACVCTCGGGRRTTLPTRLPSRDYSGYVMVRLEAGVEDDQSEDLYELAKSLELVELKEVLETSPDELRVAKRGKRPRKPPKKKQAGPAGGLKSRAACACMGVGKAAGKPRGGRSGLPRGQQVRLLRALERRAAGAGYRPPRSLASYWRLDACCYTDVADRLVERLNAVPQVEVAYLELRASNPFADDQNYLEGAPVGIGLRELRKLVESRPPEGRAAAGDANDPSLPSDPVVLCDLEQQWRIDHVEFANKADLQQLLHGVNRDAPYGAHGSGGSGNHGNAVLGQLIGTERLKGAVAGVAKCVLASHYHGDGEGEAAGPGHVAEAILDSLAATHDEAAKLGLGADEQADKRLEAGDVLLLEVQRGGYPTEIHPLDFDAIRLATALGVIVVEAAGNGGHDLDAFVDDRGRYPFNRHAYSFRDSGAILVGAAHSALPHDRAPFSNYGSRVDCFAWGDGVTTCGYGDLSGSEPKDFYTNSFNGTSSAAPTIAAAATLVQTFHRRFAGGNPVGVAEMRQLLSDPTCGTRQGPGRHGHIGVMPNLEMLLRRKLSLAPDVYMRRHVGDDGATPGRDESVSSSPDLVVAGPGAEASALGEGDAADQPAPGGVVPEDSAYSLFVRLRNRGAVAGEVEVQVFAAPATTLITPVLWHAVDGAKRVEVPPGDLLKVEPIDGREEPFVRTAAAGKRPLSFLAVTRPVREREPRNGNRQEEPPPRIAEQMLPPGPPYFDWREYRRFLRSPGVAWRNVHREKVSPPEPTKLPFFIAGTPDVARRFDFEVIQRLPATAGLEVVLPHDAAAKLLQRQPSLGPSAAEGDDIKVALPRRPRLPIRHVTLDAKGIVPATFVVTGTKDLLTGHSLAIRQLWQGIEVGRITWYFET